MMRLAWVTGRFVAIISGTNPGSRCPGSKRCFSAWFWDQTFARTSLGRDGLTAALGAVMEKRTVLFPALNSRAPQWGQDRRGIFLSFPAPPECLGHRLSPVTQRGGDRCGRLFGAGETRDGKGRASLAGPSRRGHQRAHAVLSHPWGRRGVCPDAPPHGLWCQPHGLSVSPAWLPVTSPHRAFHPATLHLVLFFSSCDMVPSSFIKSEALQPKVGQ